MTKKLLQFTAPFLLAFLMIAISACGQDNNRPSPPATATGKAGGANITINYSSPAVKGRKIWGELVPYNQVWRAGANEATIFSTDKDIMVEGKKLPAGKYSLFALPGENEWQIIFNSQTGQWGTQYDQSKDFLRVPVKPVKSSTMNERLAYVVNNNGFTLKWENLEVPVRIK